MFGNIAIALIFPVHVHTCTCNSIITKLKEKNDDTFHFSFQVSEHLLSIYLDEYPDTPWDALKYLVCVLGS